MTESRYQRTNPADTLGQMLVYKSAYDAAGNVTSVTDAETNVVTMTYDRLHRLLTRSGDTESVSFGYDKASQLLTQTDGMSRVTTLDYDVMGRMESVLSPAPGGGATQPETTYVYQDLGTSSVVTIEDTLGNGVVRTWNALGWLTSENHEGAVTSYTHDAVGNLLTLTDPVANETAWIYDNLDRVTTETNELNEARTFVYDLASNLTSKTDRNGRVTEYAYDDLYRLTSEEWLVGSSVDRTLSFAYDTASQLVTASDPAAEYEYTYDALGRLDVETQNIVGLPEVVFDNGYNLKGARTTVSASINGTLDFLRTYTRDERDRVTNLLESQQSGGNGVVRKEIDFGYNDANQYELIERYEGTSPTLIASSAFDYDGAGRLKDLHHTNSTTTLARYQFDWDAGNRIEQIDSHVDGVTTFTHDTKNQLTAADHSSSGPADETYSFDANGNRNSSGYTVTANNRISTDGIYNYTYDDEGNRLSRTHISSGNKEEYAWDHRNRLVTITFKNSSNVVTKTVDQTYDPFNHWIKRTVDADGTGSGGDVDTYFAHESGQITFQWEDADGAGTTDDPELAHRYTWAEGVDHFLADEQISTPGTAGNVLWGLGDHLGTLRDIVDLISSTVSVVNHRDYNSFGSLTSEMNSAIDLLFGFTSRPFDEASGKQNNLHRWYDVELKQWLSEDWIGFAAQDPNLRRYVGNSPLQLSDPGGLQERPVPPGIFGPDAANKAIKELADSQSKFPLPPSEFMPKKANAAALPVFQIIIYAGHNYEVTDSINELYQANEIKLDPKNVNVLDDKGNIVSRGGVPTRQKKSPVRIPNTIIGSVSCTGKQIQKGIVEHFGDEALLPVFGKTEGGLGYAQAPKALEDEFRAAQNKAKALIKSGLARKVEITIVFSGETTDFETLLKTGRCRGLGPFDVTEFQRNLANLKPSSEEGPYQTIFEAKAEKK